MKKVRITQDVKLVATVTRNGAPEDFTNVSEFTARLVHTVYTDISIPLTKYIIVGNVITMDVPSNLQTMLGKYDFELKYSKPSILYQSGFEHFPMDIPALEFVAKSYLAGGVDECADLQVQVVNISGDVGINRDGNSAYQTWLALGNVGTEADFIASLKGEKGDDGIPGDTGGQGNPGISAYQVWLDLGHTGTEAEFIASLKGEPGQSIYAIWLALGNTGTEAEFLASLKGKDGTDGAPGIDGTDGAPGIDGTDGSDGLSAYQVWLALGNTGTEADFISSLKGEQGEPGSVNVVQDRGTSTTSAMSQKAVTDELVELESSVPGTTPIASVTFNENREIALSAVDVATNTFTSAGHGLVNGNMVCMTFNAGYSDDANPLVFFPGGMRQVAYYVVDATTDTFRLSTENGGAAIDITANASMDLNKVHFELKSTGWLPIYDLPPAFSYKARVYFKVAAQGNSGLQLRPENFPNAGQYVNSLSPYSIGWADFFAEGASYGFVEGVFSNASGYKVMLINGVACKLTSPSDMGSVNVELSNLSIKKEEPTAITAILFMSTAAEHFILNGTIVEIYKA